VAVRSYGDHHGIGLLRTALIGRRREVQLASVPFARQERVHLIKFDEPFGLSVVEALA